MFEKLSAVVERAGQTRARSLIQEVAKRIAAGTPRDVEVRAEDAGVRLSGRGLRRRFAVDPAFRWLLARLK